MSGIYLPRNASGARLREAQQARRNRAEIVRELSWGRVSRRDLFKWGLFTGAGLLAPIGGLNPFVASVKAAAVGPTGAPPSPLYGCTEFSQPMPRFDVVPRNPVTTNPDGTLNTCLSGPSPQAASNQTLQPVDALLGGGSGPIEGRPPGTVWAHQRFNEFLPRVTVEMTQAPSTTNYVYNPGVASSLNSGI